ncbi:two component transcriptional regulator, LuxR family [Chitinophaga sp. CF118]|uniref:response regulator n=1 Tax=Chitinophaga sp. CF118 TaxID=1884367 RepID=UPI0008E2421E|nr:response regulator transcription factor [Chitinophaga sp. CF118]SFE50782.1 two component transcriptional regulator, LuxR family [Chitinophaga sp. CF118]
MITTAIVEDQSRYRDLLRLILTGSDSIQLLFEREHCRNILDDVVKEMPDVLIMDIDLPGKSGIDAVIELKAVFPEIKILMLTVFEDDEKIFSAIKAGANGYLLKKDSPQKILDAIREVSEGKASMNGLIAKKVMEYFRKKPATNMEEFNLTRREHEILELLIEGLSYKEIAAKCYISPETMNSHIKNIYQKLNVHSRAQISARFGNSKPL